MKIYQNVTELIGNTPTLKINNINTQANIFVKCEFMNPTGSIKDRISYSMIKDALDSNKITKNTTIIEPTSGNTGIGLASICASLGLKLIITMPESMSIERRKIISIFGAELELTPKEKGMKGAVERAKELHNEIKDSIILDQFSNPSNPNIHRNTTAKEILEALGDIKIDVFVAGVGTGGCLSGVGEILKNKNPSIEIIAVEPKDSPVLSGGNPGAHKIQGIGAGFVPDNLNTTIYKEIIKVDSNDAYIAARELAEKEGLLVGISSGANFYSAKLLAKKYPNKNILTILNDTGERYLSTELFDI
ncbi:cysteine synthase A [Helicobacter sp. MIT 14-3879]|uniref:cysteine synthase A n=1 Tax=Helicobacter sp. MIT 14-3879 TaxID=2040649 RepID=UPI000E1EBAEB|nr:cysteine synthase A [Helicobacter sp. MIT 14-3879]RDU62455.1 cysteine synthase A [Helicobacter sp. MIT 14-3879]